jgi:hypothetical protein
MTGAKTKLQAAIDEDVGGGHLAGQQRRVPERGVEDKIGEIAGQPSMRKPPDTTDCADDLG